MTVTDGEYNPTVDDPVVSVRELAQIVDGLVRDPGLIPNTAGYLRALVAGEAHDAAWDRHMGDVAGKAAEVWPGGPAPPPPLFRPLRTGPRLW